MNRAGQRELYYLWKKKYEDANDRPYDGNVYRDGTSLGHLADDFGKSRLVEAIDYYFDVKKHGHDLRWFIYNCDRLLRAKQLYEKDAERRAQLRKQTKERMESE